LPVEHDCDLADDRERFRALTNYGVIPALDTGANTTVHPWCEQYMLELTVVS
jgi:hypothetical protein